MTLALISGSGFYDLPELSQTEIQTLQTPFGEVAYRQGNWQGQELIFIARHGWRHSHLSHQVEHRAHLWACHALKAEAVLACSVVGVVNPDLPLGQLLLPNELYFPDNRLADGSACTIFNTPGASGRGHFISGSHFNQALAEQFKAAAVKTSLTLSSDLTYGQVQGPRFNSRSEIRALAQAGVDCISQTLGPEAVLAGELELPYAALCFGVDYANGVQAEPTPIATLQANLKASKSQFLELLSSFLTDYQPVNFEGFVFRFD